MILDQEVRQIDGPMIHIPPFHIEPMERSSYCIPAITRHRFCHFVCSKYVSVRYLSGISVATDCHSFVWRTLLGKRPPHAEDFHVTIYLHVIITVLWLQGLSRWLHNTFSFYINYLILKKIMINSYSSLVGLLWSKPFKCKNFFIHKIWIRNLI